MATATIPPIQMIEQSFQQKLLTQLNDLYDAYFASYDASYLPDIDRLIYSLGLHSVKFTLIDDVLIAC